jgi:filamentous hemagglutinin family protein
MKKSNASSTISVGANSFAHQNKDVRMNSHPQYTFRITTLVLALAAIGMATLHSTPVYANPQGGQVVAGSATITQQTPTKVTITQTTDKAIVNWQSYSIAPNEQVQYYQPSAASVTLNRVVGADPSQILGRLTANGQVFLVNPNGIYFGKNAQIDVAGLVASTHNIRNEDFLAGRYNFTIPGKPGAAVINEGAIHIADTGIAAFVAPSVANRGVIVARLGRVMLASANGFTLDFSGDQLVTFLVNDQVAQTAFDLQGNPLTSFVENAGRIEAQGGYVLLSAKAAENAIHSVINQTGSIEATTVGTHNGTIILNAGSGSLNVAGTLDASAPMLPSPSGRGAGGEGNGGFIETSGAHVTIDPNAIISTAAPSGKTGTWLIDPTDFTIAANGGDITGAALAARLATSNIEIQTLATGTTGLGDIFVNDAVTWNTLNELVLTAHQNVNVNSAINALGGGSVRLRADSLGTGVGSVHFTGSGHVTVTGPAAVGIYYNPISYISASTKSDSLGNPYTANVTLNGGGAMTAYMLVNDVNQLQAINTNLSGNYALGKNIDATATSGWNAGAGFLPIGDAINTFTGILNGNSLTISGLSINRPTTINVGMFVTNAGFIRRLGLINANVTGNNATGVLASNNTGSITDSYTTGSVTGGWTTGGLLASNSGTITRSYSASNVLALRDAGGLSGTNSGAITDSYATGIVTGKTTTFYALGSLVGVIYGNSVITNSFGAGTVSIPGGGLGGYFCAGWDCPAYIGNVTNSYWNTQTVGQNNWTNTAFGTGLTTAQMQQQASFAGWDFVNTWEILPGATSPTLRTHVTTFTKIMPNSSDVTPPVVIPPVVTPPVVTPPVVTPPTGIMPNSSDVTPPIAHVKPTLMDACQLSPVMCGNSLTAQPIIRSLVDKTVPLLGGVKPTVPVFKTVVGHYTVSEPFAKTNKYGFGYLIDTTESIVYSDGSVDISFPVYNSKPLYLAVEVFDKDGILIDTQLVDPKLLNTSVTDDVKEKLFDQTFGNEPFWGIKNPTISKKTDISIKVPKGGYVRTSYSSNTAQIANGFNMVLDTALAVLGAQLPEGSVSARQWSALVSSVAFGPLGESIKGLLKGGVNGSTHMDIATVKAVAKQFMDQLLNSNTLLGAEWATIMAGSRTDKYLGGLRRELAGTADKFPLAFYAEWIARLANATLVLKGSTTDQSSYTADLTPKTSSSEFGF